MAKGFFTFPIFYRDLVQRLLPGSHFVEVGVLEGESLKYLCREIKNSGKDIKVTGVDHFKDQSEGAFDEFKKNMGDLKCTIIIGDSVEASKQFNSVDAVFIDASHDYNSVKKEILAWLPKVTGVIAGHDYPTYEGVVRAVDEIFGDRVNKNYVFEGCWMVNIKRDG